MLLAAVLVATLVTAQLESAPPAPWADVNARYEQLWSAAQQAPKLPPASGRALDGTLRWDRAHRYLGGYAVFAHYYEVPGGGHLLESLAPAIGQAWADMLGGVTRLPNDGLGPVNES